MSRSTRFLRARSLVVAAVALAVASCDSATSPTAPPLVAPVLTTVTAIWDSNINAYATQDLTSLPAVVVRDQYGRGMPGVAVSFAVTAGGGTLRFPEAITSAAGIARLQGWILGPQAGENIVTATVSQSFILSFRLVATPADDACLGCWDY